MSKEVKNTLSQIPALIPELYFDVICRITPGAIFAVATCWFLRIHIDLNWCSLLIGLFFAYLTGMILDCLANRSTILLSIWYSWRVFERYCIKEDLIEIRKLLDTGDPSNKDLRPQNHKEKRQFLETVRSCVRNHPPYRAVLQKLIAEERLMKNAAVGFPLCLLMVLLVKFHEGSFLQALPSAEALIFSFRQDPLGPLLSISRMLAVYFVFSSVETLLIIGTLERIERTVVRTFYLWRELKPISGQGQK